MTGEISGDVIHSEDRVPSQAKVSAYMIWRPQLRVVQFPYQKDWALSKSD